jgi:multisubunit Na+/H+ antiporter MnhE subunit
VGRMTRYAISAGAGALIIAVAAANFDEGGLLIGAVFGLAAAYLTHEYLTRRAEEKLTREKWKDYE